jgi:hypothetical protein
MPDACRLAPRLISSHADHRRSDFVFPRTQSAASRNAPWQDRIKPMRSWGEIGAYGVAALAATALVTALI